ncbi:Notchless protein-like protein [Bienertia sinuspersici]
MAVSWPVVQGHYSWSPDGKNLVSGSKAGELQCWDPQTGKPSGGPFMGTSGPVPPCEHIVIYGVVYN